MKDIYGYFFINSNLLAASKKSTNGFFLKNIAGHGIIMRPFPLQNGENLKITLIECHGKHEIPF